MRYYNLCIFLGVQSFFERLYFLFDMSFEQNSRRDFLKILIGATGASFVTLPLGCSQKEASKAMQRLSPSSISTLLKRQSFESAHRYIRNTQSLPQHSKEITHTCDVLIIGSGPSGLAAAYSLQKNGYSVLIVENESQSGGTGIKGSWNGISYPYGSVYFVTNEGQIKEFIEAANVQPIIAPEDAVLFNNVLYPDIWSDATISTLPINQQDKDGMKQFRDYLLIDSHIPSYPLEDKLSPEFLALDKQSGRDFLRQFHSPFTETLLNLYSKSSMGAGIDDTNAYCLLNFYRSELGKNFDALRFTFPGGMNELYAGITQTIGSDTFLYNHLAIESKNVQYGTETICITHDDHIVRIQSAYTIMAINKLTASRICKDLTTQQISAMQTIQYPPYITIHLHSDKQLFPDQYMDIWTVDTGDFCTDIICSNAMQRKPNANTSFVYSLYGALPLNKRSMLLDDVLMAEHAYDIVSKLAKTLKNGMMEHVHEIECFAWGHSVAIPSIGSHSGIAQLSRKNLGNIFFAAYDNDNTSSFENAVYYGFNAAEIIGNKLRS